jgi:NAD(P)-dependent dehydrogenase (short-subunit alcohol dehydrogenase family)
MATFTDKVAIVTGASAGIGKALCLALAQDRPRLVLAAPDEDRLQGVAAACRQRGADTLVVPTDVAEPDDCRRLVERTVECFGRIDCLVNNAGVGAWTRFADVHDPAIFERLMRVNYLGCVYCTWHALPHLVRTRGRLAAVASVAGLVGVPMYTAYAPSKHAVFGFCDSLRIELAGTGVSVTVIAPDFVATEIYQHALNGDSRPLASDPWARKPQMSAEDCARRMLAAIVRRRRRLVLSWRGRLAMVGKTFFPGLLDFVVGRTTAAWK